jgi:L1 cell adhesion molecule like protein
MCQPLFKKTLKCLDLVLVDAKLRSDEIDEIILVGGSTRIPMVRNMLQTYFNGKHLNYSVNPDEAVAYGAAIQGAILSNGDSTGKCAELLLIDVIPLSLGLKTTGGKMNILIPRNSSIPTSRTLSYTTIEDNQRTVDVEIYEGERAYTADCHLLGKFTLSDIPKGVKGSPKIDITFSIDSDGILSVSAVERKSQVCCSMIVNRDGGGRLSTDEIDRMIVDADKYKRADGIRRETEELVNEFVTYIGHQQKQITGASCGENPILSVEDSTFCTQLLLKTLSWMQTDKPDIVQLQDCRKAVEFHLRPYIQKIYAIGDISNDAVVSVSDDKIQELINLI